MKRQSVKSKAREIINELSVLSFLPYTIIKLIPFLTLMQAQSKTLSNYSYDFNFLGNIVNLFFLLGFINFMIYTVNNKEINNKTLLFSINNITVFLKSIMILLLMQVLIMLGFVFLIIPGIILSFSYVMVPYLIVKEPDLGIIESLKLSRKLMNGYKVDYWVFQLSFILWFLSTVLILPIFYVIPYYHMSEIIFFESIYNKYRSDQLLL